MRLRKLLAILFLFVAGTAYAQMDIIVPNDTAIRRGVLPNGLTYYIRYNNWPENRAYFYIAQKVGSLQEEENQRGLAHFLEHMAFNGSDNFKGNSLIEWCRSKGIEFGRDLNAYTTIDQTVYNIDNVPTGDRNVLDSCLLILRDWADGLTLDPKEIDKERGVIREEWRLTSTPGQRMLQRSLEKLYPGSKYGRRMPIGLMSVIENFKHQELRDYYEKWYHPTNQGIIVVGDVDVAHTEAMIKKIFSPIQNPKDQAPVEKVAVPDNAEPIVVIEKDKEQNNNSVELFYKYEPVPDSEKGKVSYLLHNYMKEAVVAMLNQRLSEVSQQPSSSFVAAGVRDGNYLYASTKRAFAIAAQPKSSSRAPEALRTVFVEVLRALQHGFTATEYARYRVGYMANLEKQYSNRGKVSSAVFINQCKDNFLDNMPMPSLEYHYQLMKTAVPQIPLEAVNDVLKAYIPEKDYNKVIVSFNAERANSTYPTEEQLLAAVKEARAEKIEAYVDHVKDDPLMTALPTPGTIKKEVKNDKFGYTEFTLSNGVKVVLKKTDFKKDEVLFFAEGNGGSSLYGLEDIWNVRVFDQVIASSGLGNFSNMELGKALTGKFATATMKMTERNISITGTSTPKDVETMLQLVYLNFTDIKKDQQSFNNLMMQVDATLKNRDKSPDVAFSDTLTNRMYGNNPRRAPLTNKELQEVNYDRILQIAKERTASAKGWEFSIIGNFDEAKIRPLICQYLGSLPTKGKATKGKRLEKLSRGQSYTEFSRKMEVPRTSSMFYWYNEKMPYSIENGIKAIMMGEILSMTYIEKIREEAGAAYTISAAGRATLSDDGYRLVSLNVQCPMKPEKKDLIVNIIRDELQKLAETCDEEKLNKSKMAIIKRRETAEQTNGFWQSVIKDSRKVGIDPYTNYKELVEKQTSESLSAFAAEFLKDSHNIAVVMLPEL